MTGRLIIAAAVLCGALVAAYGVMRALDRDGPRIAAPDAISKKGNLAARLPPPGSAAIARADLSPLQGTSSAQPKDLKATTGTLVIPVVGVDAKELSDTFTDSRNAGHAHEAIDITAPRGTPVVAVADGRVAKLFNSKPGGLTVYQFDRDERLAYYYAHLDRYAPGLMEGRQLKRGELIGFVGSSGNADPAHPHLHFAVFELGPEKRWWEGRAINPYPLLAREHDARR